MQEEDVGSMEVAHVRHRQQLETEPVVVEVAEARTRDELLEVPARQLHHSRSVFSQDR